jgi:hypothetical protein
MIRSDVPPRNVLVDCEKWKNWIRNVGNTATIARYSDPGRVRRDRTRSR